MKSDGSPEATSSQVRRLACLALARLLELDPLPKEQVPLLSTCPLPNPSSPWSCRSCERC